MPTIYKDCDHIMINYGANSPYLIALERCNTQEKILAWVLHLTEKTWMNCNIVNSFILLATEHNNVVINRAV